MKNNNFAIPMMYYYKGSSNIALHLTINDFGNVEARTDFGEFIGVYNDGSKLAKMMLDLSNGAYAE